MMEFIISAGTAMWLGILTSISPCPLATNIAAISFIGRNIKKAPLSLLSGLAYTMGRTVVYVILGFIFVSSAQIVPALSMFLQQKLKIFMGPFLVIIGVILLDLVKIRLPGTVLSVQSQQRLARSGMVGAFILGIIFALSFCPVSAALFFWQYIWFGNQT